MPTLPCLALRHEQSLHALLSKCKVWAIRPETKVRW